MTGVSPDASLAPAREATPDQPAKRRGSFAQRCFYWFAWSAVTFLCTLLYRLRRHGLDNIPREGGVLLVCNHQSHLDPPIIGLCVRNRQFRPLARQSLFRVPLLGGVIRALNAIPLRDNEGDVQAIRAALEQLRAGEVVSVFPEGTRTPDGEIGEFRRGATLLLKRARCPVVPLAIEGAFDVWPRHRSLPSLWGGPIRVLIGKPIAPEELLRDGPDAAVARLREEIVALHDRIRKGSCRR